MTALPHESWPPTFEDHTIPPLAVRLQDAPATPEEHIAFLADRLGEERDRTGSAQAEADAWRYTATHDELTHVLNRTGFNIVYEEFERVATETGQPFALIFLDPTNFKAVNDTFGHDKGDEVLIGVTSAGRATLRVEDNAHRDYLSRLKKNEAITDMPAPVEPDVVEGQTVARTGGDEILLLVDLTQKAGRGSELTLKERADGVMKRLGVRLDSMADEDPELKQVGFGVAKGYSIWRPGVSPKVLTKEAEEVMYREKEEQHRTLGQYRKLDTPTS